MFLADYLSYNDPSAFSTIISSAKSKITNASASQYQSLMQRLAEIEKACDTFIAFKNSEKQTDRLFYKDIEPWVLKLHDMAVNAQTMCRLAATAKDGNAEEIWEDYVQANKNINELWSAEKYTAYALEGMGSGISVSWHNVNVSRLYFTPFMPWLQENALNTYLTHALPSKVQLISNLENTTGISARQNSSTKAYYVNCTRDVTLGKNQYFGLSLPQPVRVSDITVESDLSSRFAVQYSADGRQWYDYQSGENLETSFVKYLILLNRNDDEQTLRTSSKNFYLSPMKQPTISSVSVPEGDNAEDQPLSNLTDGDYTTGWAVKKNQENGDTYVLNLAEAVPIYDVRICVGTKNEDYMNTARVEASADGTSWTTLKILGTSEVNFTLSNSNVLDGGNGMKYCTFNGGGMVAKYVRLRVTDAKTNKWLRLFEMEVNRHSLVSPQCSDDKGRMLSEVYDGKAGTKASPSGAKYVTYELNQLNKVNAIYIYHDATKVNALDLWVQENDALQKVGKGTTSLVVMDMTPYTSPQNIRISWSGTVVPDFYEIEQDLGAEMPVYTGIKNVDADNGVAWHIENGRVVADCPKQVSSMEVYSLNGSKLGTFRRDENSRISLSVSGLTSPVVIVRMMFQNGKSVTKRLLLKP